MAGEILTHSQWDQLEHISHWNISPGSSQNEQTHFTVSFGWPGLDSISPLSSNSSNKKVRRKESVLEAQISGWACLDLGENLWWRGRRGKTQRICQTTEIQEVKEVKDWVLE